jgi:hypothetical protein
MGWSSELTARPGNGPRARQEDACRSVGTSDRRLESLPVRRKAHAHTTSRCCLVSGETIAYICALEIAIVRYSTEYGRSFSSHRLEAELGQSTIEIQ